MKVVAFFLVFLMLSQACFSKESEAMRPGAHASIGGNKAIFIPVPRGFVALGNRSASFSERMNAAERGVNKDIEILLTERDFKRAVIGSAGLMDSHIVFSSPSNLFGVDITHERFEAGIAFARKKVFSKSDFEAGAKAFLADHRDLRYDVTSTGNAKYVGVFLSSHDSIGFTTCLDVLSDGRTYKRCAAQVFMYVKSRVILINATGTVSSASDISALSSLASKESAGILRLN